MALEQWEIELRKQLEGTSSYKPKEKTWEDKLREQISNVQPAPSPHPHQPPKKNNLVFVGIIIVLMVACVFAFNMKTGAITNLFKHGRSPECASPPPSADMPLAITPPPNKQLSYEVQQLRLDLERMRTEDRCRYDEIQKRLKWNGDRITLLGMLNNENWLVIRNQGANSTQFIYFNSDWTLSGMPQYLQLTAEDRAFLEKYKKK